MWGSQRLGERLADRVQPGLILDYWVAVVDFLVELSEVGCFEPGQLDELNAQGRLHNRRVIEFRATARRPSGIS